MIVEGVIALENKNKCEYKSQKKKKRERVRAEFANVDLKGYGVNVHMGNANVHVLCSLVKGRMRSSRKHHVRGGNSWKGFKLVRVRASG